jgi:hypothetical protein
VPQGEPGVAAEGEEAVMQDEEVHMNSNQKEVIADDFSFPPPSIED